MIWWWIGCCALFQQVSAALVQTTHGPLQGKTVPLFNGKSVDAFLGVPYAAPPIGPYRFAPPQPLQPWSQPLKATELPKSCYQAANDALKKAAWYVSESEESEDCLYLNLWRPRDVQENLPVMIWIHGGALIAGSSNLPFYDGGLLAAEQNVIVVSINYRLSALGFLYLGEDDGVPGNAGLRDQIKAIEWIRDNAASFGGDVDRITLFGQSAGGFSVTNHMLIPSTSALFNNAIAQSGSVEIGLLSHTPERALDQSLAYASSQGCSGSDRKKLLACLRSKSPEELLEVWVKNGIFAGQQLMAVRNGREVPLDPSSAASRTPHSAGKSFLTGFIPSELNFVVQLYLPGKSFSDNLTCTEEDFKNVLSMYGLRDEKVRNKAYRLYGVPLSGGRDLQLRDQVIDVISDHDVICPDVNFSQDWANGTGSDVYFYVLTLRPSRPIKGYVPAWAGPIHGDEILYVFGTPLNPENGFSDLDQQLSDIMMTAWANFARTSNPNYPGESFWPKATPNEGGFEYLKIDRAMQLKRYTDNGKCDFWDHVQPSSASSN